MQKSIHIRSLDKSDLPFIVSIEERLTGVARSNYWEKRIEMSEAIRPHWASLVAELNNRVVGFVFGRAAELEFGLPGNVAWIEIIGVDPAFRSQGIGRALLEQFTTSAEDHDIKTIFTLVGPEVSDMKEFFGRLGFAQGKILHFQKDINA